MVRKPIDSGEVTFQSEGRLLQELGERLVASPEVAIVELIKNSYDADSSECRIYLTDKNKTLAVADDGHGITRNEFFDKWMRIATRIKLEEETSRVFKRKLTGAKGIGRFAVRFLGRSLELESVAFDTNLKKNTRLVAMFNWSMFDESRSLEGVKIPYQLFDASEEVQTGTILKISELRESSEVVFNGGIRSSVLKIVSPISGLERGKFAKKRNEKTKDPGFKVVLPSVDGTDDYGTEDLAENVLQNYWARLTISLNSAKLKYEIYFPKNKKPAFEHNQTFRCKIKQGIFADIRFFPRRAGIFSGKGINGNEAWRWIKENSGVGIVDHGFRIKPFGYEDDDWLNLAQDKAVNRRDWRSSIMKDNFPIPEEIKKQPSLNPMLNLPYNQQLVGAVFVESSQASGSVEHMDLIPSMDREGFLESTAFQELNEIVRAGIEMLGLKDKNELDRIEKEKAKRAAEEARKDIQEAIKQIETTPTLTKKDKNRIISQYVQLSEQIDEVDEYNRKARQGLETMSLLGVIAGFMSHESDRIIHNLEEAIKLLRGIAQKHKKLYEPLAKLETSFKEFNAHVGYTSTFINAVHNETIASFKVLPQVKRIINKFGLFAKNRNIRITCDIDSEVVTPPLSIALYSGIILNLYTNALKAVIAGPSGNKQPKIVFKSWNEPKKHILEVADNGVGIPDNLKKRIWDPLFTTTSRLNNPLGSGMGLGLPLINKLIKDAGGSIRLVEAPPGFSTCFKVELNR